MSEVKPRPSGPRGRGSGRGGRGGFSTRGRGANRQTNGNKADAIEAPTIEDEGEMGHLKSMYSSSLSTMKEMFPDWTDEDLIYALQETEGDLERTIERISEGKIPLSYAVNGFKFIMTDLGLLGNISQWGEVKKKNKDRPQTKTKEPGPASAEATTASIRGGRGRGGLEGSRGGRGRGSDRGRATTRGGRGAASAPRSTPVAKTNGVVASETPSWDTAVDQATGGSNWDTAAAQMDSTPLESSWENITTDSVQASGAEPPKPSIKPDGTRSWASMFAKPAPAPAPPKAPRAAPSHDAPIEAPVAAPSDPPNTGLPGLPPPISGIATSEMPSTPPTSDIATSEQVAYITPTKDDLTETNLEQVPDTSGPALSATAASTVASTLGPGAGATALHSSQQQSSSRPPLDGYATTAYKATGIPGRTTSYQRKIMEQQEAVVMPGKHAVDRAAVQFGSMGLNGTPEDVDVDSDREDAETRAQPPQHSPIAPRAALPPAPQQQGFSSQAQPQAQANEAFSTPRQAPGLPPAQAPHAQQSSQPFGTDTTAPHHSVQASHPYNQFSDRYGTQAAPQEPASTGQKPYEPFGQQLQQPQYDGYPSTANAQSQNQSHQPNQSMPSGYSSASNDVSSYYTSDSQRNAYQNNYYGNYGQQPQSTQETGASQQRAGSAFGTSAGVQGSQYATAHGQQGPQARYGQTGEDQTSGHSTPNLSQSGQPQTSQPHSMLQQQQSHGQGSAQHGAYPYGGYGPYGNYYSSYNMNQVSNHPYGRERPMFDDVRRYDDQCLTQNHQYGYGGNQGGYGGGPFGGAAGKQGMYGQPHQGYGMSPQASYDQHSASPANVGAFGQQLSGSAGRDTAASGGLGNYGRSGSAQPTDATQAYSSSAAAGQANPPDVFGRSQSGYPGTSHGLGSNMGHQGGNEDSLRSYGDSSKVPGGPSPAVGQSGARPGSAANPQGQSGLPAPQSERYGQQGYSGYPSHMNHQMHGQQGSQYGPGPGGAAGHQSGGQSHQAGGYGGYGAAGGYGGSYYGNSNRGGWGANYGH